MASKLSARSRCEGTECDFLLECVLYEAHNGLKIVGETTVYIRLCSCASACVCVCVCACVCVCMCVHACWCA
jgi:hypothetical protein